jgi:hypothetical protein
MADNKQIKDGLGNVFTLRMRDISQLSDGSVMQSIVHSSLYPLDYGGGGIFQHVAKSGVMAAMVPPGSSIYAFRWPSAGMLALIWRMRLMAWTVTAFSGGLATFDLFAARAFTAGPTGGIPADLSGENNQLRTSMAASSASIMYANTGALTPGIRTLDAAPMESFTALAPITDNTLFPNEPIILFEKEKSDHPLLLAQNEGFVIQASVPQSNSTWQFAVTLEWNEVQQF